MKKIIDFSLELPSNVILLICFVVLTILLVACVPFYYLGSKIMGQSGNPAEDEAIVTKKLLLDANAVIQKQRHLISSMQGINRILLKELKRKIGDKDEN